MVSKRSPSRTMQSFEMESGTNASNEGDYSSPQSPPTGQVEDAFASAFGQLPKRREHAAFDHESSTAKARKLAILRYVGLSTVAAIAAMICPGSTIVWRDSKSSLQYYSLKITAVYILVMISFFTLQDSDPGYLTPAILEHSIEGGQALLSEDSGNANDDISRETQDGAEGNDTMNEKADIESGIGGSPSTLHAAALQQALDVTSDPLAAPSKSSLEDEFGAFGSSVAPLALNYRKPCVLCAIPKPPLRSHHCKICSKCVATFDHHCGFLATCIGERNHVRFWIFVGLNVISIRICCEIANSSSYGMTTMLLKSKGQDHDYNKLILLSFMVVLAKIYLYLVWLAAHMLFVVHTYLILTNKTTFEMNIGNKLDYMRDTQPMDCIFSKGCWENIRIRCLLDSMWVSSAPRAPICCPCCHSGKYQLIRRSRESNEGGAWSPMIWKREENIIRDSEDWWNHPWQNKYWQCC